ncbi:MAG: acetyl-CoA carboxylase biotin carboxylase subunit [bacterium]|nr:acetyl-CoA carboxylase biotin carboxylase subunit [bacterium]
MFNKLLIANRGEIAVRVIRTCKEMGIKTVAVYSTADEDSLHVRLADESVCIGPPEPAKSYLNVVRIISAAELADADAVHPGYGFLAENPYFAEACTASKIAFIGPTYDVISKMGDKALARKLMQDAGVPVIPGSDGPVQNEDDAQRVAGKIGYPVMVKASAGGGGRGMRIAHTEASLKKAYTTASMEAEAAFGNPEVYIEKLIINPRHVEVQIMGDGRGNVIHLGERDCSVQRRHQKLVEESPAPGLDKRTRDRLFKAAVNGAAAVDYLSAGTVEFLVDENGDAYFIEMNARVQVEHPVSEMVSGEDIIRLQILVGSGYKLRNYKINLSGHSIECRVNAEDPDNDFRPSPGTVTHYLASGGTGVRVDSHLYSGYKVPATYDSLIAKLIVWAPSRDRALERMKRALGEMVIEGIATTIPIQYRIVSNSRFKQGAVDTSFIEELQKTELS